MSVDRLCAYYGFTRVPFGRDLSPASLFHSAAHQEAVARLTWLIDERGLGILTGEVGAGKTVAARATTARLEPSRFQVVYCPKASSRRIVGRTAANWSWNDPFSTSGLGSIFPVHRTASARSICGFCRPSIRRVLLEVVVVDWRSSTSNDPDG